MVALWVWSIVGVLNASVYSRTGLQSGAVLTLGGVVLWLVAKAGVLGGPDAVIQPLADVELEIVVGKGVSQLAHSLTPPGE